MMERQDDDKVLVVWGYVLSVLIPIVGFFIGLAVMIRGKRAGHGVAMMVIAVVVIAIFTGIAIEQASNEAEEALGTSEEYFECLQDPNTTIEECDALVP
jgi:C4-dicarboxylate transporter